MDSSTAIYKESRAEHPSERRSVAYVRQRYIDAKERTNDQWLAALRGPRKDQALADLRTTLVSGLRAALRGGANGAESLVEDFAQEALIKILANLDSSGREPLYGLGAKSCRPYGLRRDAAPQVARRLARRGEPPA